MPHDEERHFSRELLRQIDAKLEKVNVRTVTMNRMIHEMAKTFADVQADVAAQKTVSAGIVTMIGGLRQQLADLKNAGGATPEQLQSLDDDLTANTAALAAAAIDNTGTPAPAAGDPQAAAAAAPAPTA